MQILLRTSLITFLLSLMYACGTPPVAPKDETKTFDLRGKTMGKIAYMVLYSDSLGRDFNKEVNQLLVDFNQEMSTYIPDSKISTFNQTTIDSLDISQSKHFVRNVELSKEIYAKTNNWFNPAVMPLVNYWGFGYTEKKAVEEIDSNLVDSLVHLVNFDQISLKNGVLYKKMKGAQLDFSAIAKGDAVDEIGRFLESKGIQNYMVEIGGEVRARGKSETGRLWYVGINTPKAEASTQDVEYVIELNDRSMATSGNYRNFYEVDGKKYAHTINPKTGYPEQSTLLSATVFAEDCATADAYATAFMAMGLDPALEIAKTNAEIGGLFIFANASNELEVVYTDDVKDMVKE